MTNRGDAYPVRTRSAGFTLPELILVLIVLGIVSVFAVPRMVNDVPYRASAFHQELLSALRFAHKLSLTSGCEVQVTIDAATDTYALFFRDDAVGSANTCRTAAGPFGGNAVPTPGGTGPYQGTAPADVDVQNSLSFFFDREGRPNPTGGTVSLGSHTITVENETGFTH